MSSKGAANEWELAIISNDCIISFFFAPGEVR